MLFVGNLVPVAIGILHIAVRSPLIPVVTSSNIGGIVERANFPANNLVFHILGDFYHTQLAITGYDRNGIVACFEFWLAAAGVVRFTIVLIS